MARKLATSANTWDRQQNKFVETPQNIRLFLKAYENLCFEFGISIAHEDTHGSFILEPFNPVNISLMGAADIDFPDLTDQTPAYDEPLNP